MALKLKVYHSPDSDDAFMFYGITEGMVGDPELEVQCGLKDIQSLNEMALNGEADCTAVSFHAYAYCHQKYHILPHGASFGDGYGPRLIALEPCELPALRGRKIAVPGRLTSAALALRMTGIECEEVVVPFDSIMELVRSGGADAGLLIHEGQITYAKEGFHLVLDLGAWWKDRTGLPLPLGCNVIKKDIGSETLKRFPLLMKRSIDYALGHRAEALKFAKRFGRDLDDRETDTFVSMYVNEWTRGYGERGRAAVAYFLDEAYRMKLIPEKVETSFIDF